MVSSPYDLSRVKWEIQNNDILAVDLSPIMIETEQGKLQYRKYQELLFNESKPARTQLIDGYTKLLTEGFGMQVE